LGAAFNFLQGHFGVFATALKFLLAEKVLLTGVFKFLDRHNGLYRRFRDAFQFSLEEPTRRASGCRSSECAKRGF
jgi:hypothetical protein